jgi:AcrR family transcriptional regulator
VTTATALLVSTGSPEAVTLRAVARQVGIATTSIYSHFPDRAAILQAVADRAFTSLTAAAQQAGAGVSDPVARLLGGCRAYVDYAREHPQLYALMFTTAAAPGAPRGSREREPGDAVPDGAPSTAGFHGLANSISACIESGASASTDAVADAVAVWMGLHGFATLRASMTFPWPDEDAVLRHLVLSLARIRPAAAPGAG